MNTHDDHRQCKAGRAEGKREKEGQGLFSSCSLVKIVNPLFPIDTRRLTQSRFHSQVARTVNTIERNPASLCVKKFDLEFDVDPLFKKVMSVAQPHLTLTSPQSFNSNLPWSECDECMQNLFEHLWI
jgi:hypothetical protein